MMIGSEQDWFQADGARGTAKFLGSGEEQCSIYYQLSIMLYVTRYKTIIIGLAPITFHRFFVKFLSSLLLVSCVWGMDD